MTLKESLLTTARKEFETTLRVLQAIPAGREDFRPHERSSNTLKLISTFVFGMYLAEGYLSGEKADPSKFKNYKPEDVKRVLEDFRTESAKVLARLQNFPEEDLTNTVEFVGTTFTKANFLQMMIHDQIHHRGQLTVYVHLTGGSVPSVYGPSADDSSTNL